jgi:hypothetical protein
MRKDHYINALLEELRSPRSKAVEANIRAELAALNVSAPSAKALRAEAAQAKVQESSEQA